MKEYHKIDSVYKRDQKGKFILGEFSRPEFEYLKDSPWLWTEKVDGTNIRIMFRNIDVLELSFGGKTDNAQISTKLINWLNNTLEVNDFVDTFGSTEGVCLYGEGYGAGIQKGGGNYSPDQKFILFDVKIGDFWLERKNIEDIASKLSLDVVPLLEPAYTLEQMIRYVAEWQHYAPASSIGNASIEGYVGTPLVPLFARNGDRIITKIKYKDFK